MPKIFIKTFAVPDDSIDLNKHVNNIKYLYWMRDVSIEHFTAQGWPLERYIKSGVSWVVRSHHIEYLNPSHLKDSLSILTWISDMGRQSFPRKYLFWRASDQKVIAKAESIWVFVDLHTGRPRSISGELRSALDIVAKDYSEVLKKVRSGELPVS